MNGPSPLVAVLRAWSLALLVLAASGPTHLWLLHDQGESVSFSGHPEAHDGDCPHLPDDEHGGACAICLVARLLGPAPAAVGLPVETPPPARLAFIFHATASGRVPIGLLGARAPPSPGC